MGCFYHQTFSCSHVHGEYSKYIVYIYRIKSCDFYLGPLEQPSQGRWGFSPFLFLPRGRSTFGGREDMTQWVTQADSVTARGQTTRTAGPAGALATSFIPHCSDFCVSGGKRTSRIMYKLNKGNKCAIGCTSIQGPAGIVGTIPD